MNHLAFRTGVLILAGAAVSPWLEGCGRGSTAAIEDLGTVQARITSDSAGDDVVAVRVDVLRAGGLIDSQTVRVRDDQPVPGTSSSGEGADALFTLRPGAYDVVATPLDASGAPSQICATASTSALVKRGVTTEIVLAVFCQNGGTGGLDVVITIQHQPMITGLVMDPGKFLETCQQAVIDVTATDPDNGPLSYSWMLSASPPGAIVSLNAAGSRAFFLAQTPGDYEVSVVVKDPYGQFAALAFPLHVAGAAIAGECPTTTPVLVGTTKPGAVSPPLQPAALRARNVVANTAPLYPSGNQAVALNLFPDTTLKLVGIRIEPAGAGFVWVGQVRGQPKSAAFLSVRGDIVAGNIATEKGELFQIRPLGNGVHWVAQVDPGSWHAEANPDTLLPPPGDADPCGGTDTGHDIDVMVAYTAAARAAAGSTDDMEVLIYLAAAETNQGYLNSGVTQHLRLVRLTEVAYAELGVDVDRDRLKNPSDGFLDEVHGLRDLSGADIVALVIHYPPDPWCGKAYIMGSVSTTFENSAFAVVEDSCATGYYSFGHELGHIMSARHDRYVDPTDGSPYNYNHGFVYPPDGWRTVMGYNTACADAGTSCTRVLYWSNPSNTYGGVAMGVSAGLAEAADNHLTLNNTDTTVANFRCSSPGTSNVWMRDTWDDTGLEPDPHTVGEDMWKSPYVWVRTSQDTTLIHQHEHQNPTFGVPAWVYAKLHNGGGAAASGTLEMYYAEAAAGLSWPSDWTLVGSVAVASFAAHSSTVVEVPWPSVPGTGHFCLLARWVSGGDPMTFPEGANIGLNVRNNNNLVWRNINILSPGGDGAMEADFIVRNTFDAPLSLFVGPTREEVNGSVLLYTRAVITLDEILLAAWKKGGMAGQGFELLPNGGLLITDPAGATLDNLMLSPRLPGRAHLRLEPQPGAPHRLFHIEGVQSAKVPGAPSARVGGVLYELQL